MERTTRNGAIIDDRREKPGSLDVPAVVFTDSFMSGWGKAQGRSLFALPMNGEGGPTIERVLAKGRERTDMKRGRFVISLRNVKLYAGDHLSIRSRETAKSWYE